LIAVSVGDNPADFGDALTMWGLASPDDSDEPPSEPFATWRLTCTDEVCHISREG
jgi:hypothetical protein